MIIGYDASDWIVHDPAEPYTCYGCGGGEAVRYPRNGSWDNRLVGRRHLVQRREHRPFWARRLAPRSVEDAVGRR